MGICYYCELNISATDMISQKRCSISIDGRNVGKAHKDCFTLSKKYGTDYFIINQYFKYNKSLSEYDLTRILTVLNKKSVSQKYLVEQLSLKSEHVKEFWEFLIIKQYINIKIDTPILPKSDAPTLPKTS